MIPNRFNFVHKTLEKENISSTKTNDTIDLGTLIQRNLRSGPIFTKRNENRARYQVNTTRLIITYVTLDEKTDLPL